MFHVKFQQSIKMYPLLICNGLAFNPVSCCRRNADTFRIHTIREDDCSLNLSAIIRLNNNRISAGETLLYAGIPIDYYIVDMWIHVAGFNKIG